MLPILREKYDAIIALHQAHHEAVLDIQDTFRVEGLLALKEELELDENCLQWAREWVDDYGSIFRMFKKHGFDAVVTRAALESTLRWRISVLAHYRDTPQSSDSFMQCLPNTIHDVFGRPVLLVRMGELFDASDTTKQIIVRTHEDMRQRICPRLDQDYPPTLQYVMLIDFKDVAIRSMAVELIPWFIREIAPRFPGMCAAVFVVNYSWAYGMYSLVKRLLPTNVLARIHFPSESELLSCFERERFPQEYGGDLDMSASPRPSSASFNVLAEPPFSGQGGHSAKQPPHNANLSRFLPSMSTLNPYFGYPAMSGPGSSVPYLRNGRRRKRDLARTLLLLWFTKLKRLTDKTWIWIVMTLVFWALGLRGGE